MTIHCKYDELVSADALKPHPKNANKHPEDQIERLAKILNYQGWRYPIKVSRRSGFVTSGHGRILAAKHLGWERVPVNYQDYEDDDQEHADVHSDNSIAAWAELDLALINTQIGDFDPGFDIDLLGIKDFVLDPSEKEFGSGEDEVPEAPPEPVVKRGELWVLGEHRLLIDDCTVKENVERLMAGEKADMVFTDPPYGMKLKAQYSSESRLGKGLYKGKDMSRSKSVDYRNIEGDHQDWSPRLIETVFDNFAICKEIFLWGADYYAEYLPDRNDGSWVVWDKVTKQDGEVSGISDFHGSNFELCWSKARHKRDLARVMHKGLGSVENDKRVHPTQKPVKLAEWFFDHHGKDSIRIWDGYLGSGSTLIACEKTNRRCFGMEIDPHYGQVIIERFQKFSGKKAVREDGVTFDSLKIE